MAGCGGGKARVRLPIAPGVSRTGGPAMTDTNGDRIHALAIAKFVAIPRSTRGAGTRHRRYRAEVLTVR